RREHAPGFAGKRRERRRWHGGRQRADRRDLRDAGARQRVGEDASDDHSGQQVRYARQHASARQRRDKRYDSNGGGPTIDLGRVPRERRQRVDEAGRMGGRQADKIRQLRRDDQQSRAGGEADDDGGGDEVDQRAEPGETQHELDQADHQAEREREAKILRRERQRQRGERGGDHQRRRVGRSRDEVPRRTPQGADHRGKHRPVQAILRRKSGQRRICDALRKNDQRAKQTGEQVSAQRRRRDAMPPGQKRQEPQRRRRHRRAGPDGVLMLDCTAAIMQRRPTSRNAGAIRFYAATGTPAAAGGAAACCACAAAISEASTHDAMRTSIVSLRPPRTIGTFAPSTMPAASAPQIAVSVRTTSEPASRPGTIRMSAWPATGSSTPLTRAASDESALSAVSGPATTPPVITPCVDIFANAAASPVAGNAAVTPSTAASTATCGLAMPSACARSMAFCTISRLAARFGAMFRTASDRMKGRAKPPTSMKNAWVSRRSPRKPASGAATARIRSSG